MDFFLNERFLRSGRTLKCLLTDPAAIATQKPELGASFRVVGPSQATQTLGQRRPEGLKAIPTTGKQRPLRFSAFEWTTADPAATNVVEALIGGDIVSRRDFVVLSSDDYQNMLKSTQSEEIQRRQVFASPPEVLNSWNQSWLDLFTYLGGPQPGHIKRRGKSLRFYAGELPILSTDAFAFANFHINRLLFNQVFYGGEIQFERTKRRDLMEFSSSIHSTGPAPRLELGALEELQGLMTSLAIDGYRVALDWQPNGNDARLLAAWHAA
jgi:hypothetical protein